MGQQIILEILIDVRILVLSSLAGFYTSIKQVSEEKTGLCQTSMMELFLQK